MQAIEVFLENAGLSLDAVETVRMAGDPYGEGAVTVYEFMQPVDRKKILGMRAFREWEHFHQEWTRVRGVDVCNIGPISLAFPNEKTIVTGRSHAVEEAIRRGPDVPEEMLLLLEGIDPKTTLAVVRLGGSHLGLSELLALPDDMLRQVDATVDLTYYAGRLRLTRTIYLQQGLSAGTVQRAIEQGLEKAASAQKGEGELPRILRSVSVEQEGNAVTIDISLQESMLTADTVSALAKIFR